MNHYSLLAHLYILSTQPPQTVQAPKENSESYAKHIDLKEVTAQENDEGKKTLQNEAFQPTNKHKK